MLSGELALTCGHENEMKFRRKTRNSKGIARVLLKVMLKVF
jgi:hypothetical protein